MKKLIVSTLVLSSVALGTFACGGKSSGSSQSATSAAAAATSSTSTTSSPTTASSSSSSAATSAASVPTGLPAPPSTAVVFSNLEQMTNWQSCGGASCAGGSGNSALWMAQNQTTPSMTGSSMEVQNAGVLADALWWNHLGANNNVSNFLWDFYFQVDNASLTAAEALEFDAFQFVGGYNYMIGSQCNYAAGVWDTWDELHGQWIHSSIACPQFAPGVWHHIQWYVQRVPNTHNYKYVTLVVDGTSYPMTQTYSALNNGWADNLGVQYQLDVNASGAAYQEWIDQATLTVW